MRSRWDLINLRRLDEFFHSAKKHRDDVRAYEFGFQHSGPFLTTAQRREIDKQIAHPTMVAAEKAEHVYLTYLLAHRALVRVFEFIVFLLGGAHPATTPYGRSIAFTKKEYLTFWNNYTALVSEEQRLPIVA